MINVQDITNCIEESEDIVMRGRVKWFNNTKGYGFIEYNDHEDIFVHYSAIELDGYKTLSEGDLVNYELLKTSKGLQAQKVLQVNSKSRVL